MENMGAERELMAGLLSKDAAFRLIVSGTIGVREIDRLIRKLELEKAILAEDLLQTRGVTHPENLRRTGNIVTPLTAGVSASRQ